MNTSLVLALLLVAQSVPVSVSELLANPDRFNGQSVMVRGRIGGFREGATERGARYYTFDLTDGAETVPVIALVEPPCRAGAVTVVGIFERWERMSYSLDEITAQNILCLSEQALNRGGR
jgi:hypothetical protein